MPFRWLPQGGGEGDCPECDTNASVTVKPALRQTTVLTATLSEPKVGLSVVESPQRGVTDQKPAFDVDTRVVSADITKPAHTPAMNLVQVKYDLTRFIAGTDALEIGVGGAWGGVANANGEPAGAPYATLAEGAVATTGRLRLHFPDSVNKGDLTITVVEIAAYFRITGAATGTILDLRARHGDLGTDVTIQQFSNLNADHLASPYEEPITATLFSPAVGMPALSWASVDDLQFIFDGSIAVSPTTTPLFEVDAVKLRITANKTDTL